MTADHQDMGEEAVENDYTGLEFPPTVNPKRTRDEKALATKKLLLVAAPAYVMLAIVIVLLVMQTVNTESHPCECGEQSSLNPNLTTTAERSTTPAVCPEDYCGANGLCNIDVGAPRCACKPGYLGDRCQNAPRDCWDLLARNVTESDVYTITVNDETSGRKDINVFCDMTSEGGGWTVLLRRQDGSENFSRGWDDYARGFGDLRREHWIGNDVIHSLTVLNGLSYNVYFNMTWNSTVQYAEYAEFQVASRDENYNLTFGAYEGNAGDSLRSHQGMMFTTFDRDNDIYGGHCGMQYLGGWWYKACFEAKLTGLYGQGLARGMGICWRTWLEFSTFLDFAEMKLIPHL